MSIADVSPEEYASYWGCDPVYDRPPRQLGDGYLFYNFAVEQEPEFLRRFLPAIERTKQCAEPEDQDDLEDLASYVKRLLLDAIRR